MTFTDNFQCLMRGGLIKLSLNELILYIDKMNELGINTLLIQQLSDNLYICKVDELTSKFFIDQFPDTPPYEVAECSK